MAAAMRESASGEAIGGANDSSDAAASAVFPTPGPTSTATANTTYSAPPVALNCNEWLNRGTTGGAAGIHSFGRGRRHRRRSAPHGGAELRACATPGCDRSYSNGKHSHCCGHCSIGLHTERCDRAWIKVQMQPLRARISTCVTSGCQRAAGLTHLHCCTLCVWRRGADHTDACHERQSVVQARGMEDDGASAHASAAGTRTSTTGGGGGGSSSSVERPGNTLSPDVSGATAATGCEPSEYAECGSAEPLVLDAMD